MIELRYDIAHKIKKLLDSQIGRVYNITPMSHDAAIVLTKTILDANTLYVVASDLL